MEGNTTMTTTTTDLRTGETTTTQYLGRTPDNVRAVFAAAGSRRMRVTFVKRDGTMRTAIATNPRHAPRPMLDAIVGERRTAPTAQSFIETVPARDPKTGRFVANLSQWRAFRYDRLVSVRCAGQTFRFI